MMKKLAAVMVAGILVGCGGGEPEAEETVEAMSAPRAAYTRHAVKVVLFGDSTEEGNRAGTNNALIVQGRFNRRGRDIEVWQEAVGGTTALDLLTGTERKHDDPFNETIQDTSAQIVGFRYGLNDQKQYSDETFRDVLGALMRIAETAGKVVIVQTPSPTDLPAWTERAIRDNVLVIRELATAHNAVLCDHRRVGLIEGYETLDGVHPTAYDYKKHQAETLIGCIDRAIAKLP